MTISSSDPYGVLLVLEVGASTCTVLIAFLAFPRIFEGKSLVSTPGRRPESASYSLTHQTELLYLTVFKSRRIRRFLTGVSVHICLEL